MDLSILENLHTDIAVAPPEDYADSSSPNLIPEGTYDLFLKSVEPIFDKDDKSLFKGFNFQAEVADGEYQGRSTGRLSAWSTPYERNGILVSQLGDFIRAIDSSAAWSTAADAARIIQMAIERKMPVRLKLGWEAFDAAYFEEKGGKAMKVKSPEQKLLRKECTIKGMTKFPKNPDGTYRAEIEGENGDILEARLAINNFVSSHRRR